MKNSPLKSNELAKKVLDNADHTNIYDRVAEAIDQARREGMETAMQIVNMSQCPENNRDTCARCTIQAIRQKIEDFR